MGDVNQILFAKAAFKGFKGKVLEVGSKNYGSTQQFRSLFKDSDYVGIDIEAGPNVDHVVNLLTDPLPSEIGKFDLVIICSVLEHTPRPWQLADKIVQLLSDEAAVYSCHPWVWRYHKYPEDYFRFSPKGIESLFSSLNFWCPHYFSTSIIGEFFNFSENNHVDNTMKLLGVEERKYLPCLQAISIGFKSEKKFLEVKANLEVALKPRSKPQTVN